MSLRHLAPAALAFLLASCAPSISAPSDPPLPPVVDLEQVTRDKAGAPTITPEATVNAATLVAVDDKNAEEPKKVVPPDDRVDLAERAAKKGNTTEAMKQLEEALKDDPKNRRALFLLAFCALNRANDLERPKNNALYAKAVSAMRALRVEHSKDLNEQEKFMLGVTLFKEACSFALEKKEDQAFAALKEAFDAGFDRVDLLDEDEELASLRKSPRLAELKKGAEVKAIAADSARGKTDLAKGETFPFDFKLPGLDDKELKLAELKGKVVIVDVWGTWCPPCREEIPSFIALYKRFHDKGLEIVGLNYERVEPKDVKKTIQSYLEANKVPYPCLIGDEPTQEQIPDFQGFPTTLFLDRAGKVRLKVVGLHSPAYLEAIVTTLLEEKAP